MKQDSMDGLMTEEQYHELADLASKVFKKLDLDNVDHVDYTGSN